MTERPAVSDPTPASLRLLLRGVVDYAGLFPPAGLPMAEAVAHYARHHGETTAWMLGRFVLPAARLDEFERVATPYLPRDIAAWWALSALLGSDLEEDVVRVQEFNERRDARQGAALVDTVELKAHAVRDVVHAAGILHGQFDTYMEIPVSEDPAELVSAIATAGGKAKMRTGGTTPDAFPPSAQVVRFIARCVAHRVPFKATAGLHHSLRAEYPLTYEPDAPHGVMYGFLNVLLATAAIHAGADQREAVAVLEERQAEAVEFRADGARVRDRFVPLAALEAARDSMASFGSCSFAEPVADLEKLSLL